MTQTDLTPREFAAAWRSELEELVHTLGGTCTPEQYLDFAKNPLTFAHRRFNWDDTAAGHQFRLLQAAMFIRAVVRWMTIPGSKEPVRIRAYQSLPEDRGIRGYRPVATVLEDAAFRTAMLQQAAIDFKAFRARYQMLTELFDAFEAMDEALGVRKDLPKSDGDPMGVSP